MRALVIYESMFGNTRQIAESIASGIRTVMEVRLADVHDVEPIDAMGVGLLVVGAPTHGFGLSLPASRIEAVKLAKDANRRLTLEPRVLEPGVRELLDELPPSALTFASFDTRMTPDWMKSSARKHIAKWLRDSGRREIDSTSFRVEKDNRLRTGELARATNWGHVVATDAATRLNEFPADAVAIPAA